MDPKACFEAMCDNAYDGTFQEYLNELVHWFRNGGFGFDVTDEDDRVGKVVNIDYCARVTVRYRNNRTKVRGWRNLRTE